MKITGSSELESLSNNFNSMIDYFFYICILNDRQGGIQKSLNYHASSHGFIGSLVHKDDTSRYPVFAIAVKK